MANQAPIPPAQPRPPELEELDLEIEAKGGGRYSVAILSSPVGEARGELALSEVAALRASLSAFQAQVASFARDAGPAGAAEGPAAPPEFSARDLGGKLFAALFPPALKLCLYRSLDQAPGGLRIKLRILAPELAEIPWELLHDPERDRFLCLREETLLYRYLERSEKARPLSPGARLSVLGMAVSPKKLQPLEVAREQKELEEALELVPDEVRPTITWAGSTRKQLFELLEEGAFHVFHFAGHGEVDPTTGEAAIFLASEGGEADRFEADEFTQLLSSHPSLRLVVLNSCEGASGSEAGLFASLATKLIQRGVPAVLAMQSRVQDARAIEFAETFYESLGRGEHVDAALCAARKRVALRDVDGGAWATPVLWMHAKSDALLRLPPPQQKEPPPEEPPRKEPPPAEPSRRGPPLWLLSLVALAAASIIALLVGFFRREPDPPPPLPPSAPPAPLQKAILIMSKPGTLGPKQAAATIPAVAAGEEPAQRCKGYTYCVELPGGRNYPVPQNGLLLAPAGFGETSLPAGGKAPARVEIDTAGIDSDQIILHKNSPQGFTRCDARRGQVRCKEAEGRYECIIEDHGC